MLRTVGGLAGVVLVLTVWLSVLRTVFPQRQPSRATRWTVQGVSAVFSVTSPRLPKAMGERLMDLCSPVALFLMAGCWLVSQIAGFTLLAWAANLPATSAPSVARPFLPSTAGGPLAVIAWLAMALMLSAFTTHLVRLADAYSRRERLVLELAGQASRPLDADTILADYLRTGSRDRLDMAFAEWSGWLADVCGTHAADPALIFARPADDLCWLRASVIVLDVATLTRAIAPDWAPPHACSLINTGTRCFEHLAAQVGVRPPRIPVSLHGREERAFITSVRCAVEAGLPQERDDRSAWEAFQQMRIQYAPYAAGMATRLLYDAIVEPPGSPKRFEKFHDLKKQS